MTTYKGNIVLENNIIYDGYISIRDKEIVYVGEVRPDGQVEDYENCFILPGFIDVHCHGGNGVNAYENPEVVADFHLSHGTTTLLMSFYRNLSHETLLKSLIAVKELQKTKSNVLGAHLEGPYINANLGMKFANNQEFVPNKEKYAEYLKLGVIKSWTCAPEIDGVQEFIKEVKKNDDKIVVALGHSEANFYEIKKARDNGASLITHMFDATGNTTYSQPYYVGTKDLDFDLSAMYLNGFFYEIICDEKWIHVRKEMLELLIRCVGKEKIICITDYSCDKGSVENKQSDININNGFLSGSRLTMDKVVKNLFNVGYSFNDIAKFTSINAKNCFNLKDRGELKVGMRSDLVILSKDADLIKVIQ